MHYVAVHGTLVILFVCTPRYDLFDALQVRYITGTTGAKVIWLKQEAFTEKPTAAAAGGGS